MTFSEKLKELGTITADLMALGYSQRTAYYWLNGERVPKEFTQNAVLQQLKIRKDIRTRIGGN